MAASIEQARTLLHRHWGYPDFRPQQIPVVRAVLAGRDCLALLPTGGGKSLCFQVPGLALGGLTVVVSPLISLMQDQVAALESRAVSAAYLSSTQDSATRSAIVGRLRRGELQLLYVAPERLEQLPALLQGVPVVLLAIDEAHCVSEWGHDFRPHYRTIGKFRDALGSPPAIAVTATATPATRDDIARVVGLRNPVRIAFSFDRPNLRFRVIRARSERERLARLTGLIRARPALKVVYVPTRDRTDGVTLALRSRGINAMPYHAALPGPDRRRLLEMFVAREIEVMVATNAFGMGIDQPDVRLVAHLGVPPRPEAYYQEAGRAGRDGGPADCVMIWRPQDLVLARLMSGIDRPAVAGVLRQRRRGLATMRRYALGRACRRHTLLEYLGENAVDCSGCDRCEGGRGRLRRVASRVLGR